MGITLIVSSLTLLAFCFILILIIYCKHKSEKRRWINSIHAELARRRTSPEASSTWRQVSVPYSKSGKDPKESNEFEYMQFVHGDEPERKKQEKTKIEMVKEKVVSLTEPDLADDEDNRGSGKVLFRSSLEVRPKITYITTKQETIDNYVDDTTYWEPQISQQTQQIIKAIKEELNKFGTSSQMNFPDFDHSEA